MNSGPGGEKKTMGYFGPRPAAVFLALFLKATAEAGEPARVTMFSPEGTARGVRQVVARFSEPVAAGGDPVARIPVPFNVVCPAKGGGRWMDPGTWVYDFEEEVPAGIACEFSIRPGLAALSGKTIEGPRLFFFSTGGPSILRSAPYEGTAIREDQRFLLYLDAELDEASIAGNVAFHVDEAADPIAVAVLRDEERAAVIRAARYANDGPSLLAIRAARPFPEGARIRLVWGTGVRSSWGIPTEEPQTVGFTVRGPFTARFSCARSREEDECDPRLPMELRFSAPVPEELLRKVVLRGPGTAVYAPEAPPESADGEPEAAAAAVFKGPFPQGSAFTISLPPEIRDDAGRSLSGIDRFPLEVRTGE